MFYIPQPIHQHQHDSNDAMLQIASCAPPTRDKSVLERCMHCTASVLTTWCACPWCGCQLRRRPGQSIFLEVSDQLEQGATKRYDELLHTFRSSQHERHTDTIYAEFLGYLRSQGVPVHTATGRHVGVFLLMKNAGGAGRTVVHEPRGPYLGTAESSFCDCPVEMSHRTLESYRFKLETAISRSTGASRITNPAAHWECKAVLQEFKKAQLTRGVSSTITKPAWASDIRQLSEAMFYESRECRDPQSRAIILHDRAYILDAFRTVLRGTQAGHTLIQQIIWLPNKDGLLFGYTWGKTLRDGSKQTFAVRRAAQDPYLCLVMAIEDALESARAAGWDVTSGYLFRDLHTREQLKWEHAPGLTAQKGTIILKRWLRRLGLPELGVHSLRAGGALYRHFSGDDLEDVMMQAYWKSPATAEHYLQVMRMAKVAGHEVLTEGEYQMWNDLPTQELQRLVALSTAR